MHVSNGMYIHQGVYKQLIDDCHTNVSNLILALDDMKLSSLGGLQDLKTARALMADARKVYLQGTTTKTGSQVCSSQETEMIY